MKKNNNKNKTNKNKPKKNYKPFYKRWYFFVTAIIILGLIIASITTAYFYPYLSTMFTVVASSICGLATISLGILSLYQNEKFKEQSDKKNAQIQKENNEYRKLTNQKNAMDREQDLIIRTSPIAILKNFKGKILDNKLEIDKKQTFNYLFENDFKSPIKLKYDFFCQLIFKTTFYVDNIYFNKIDFSFDDKEVTFKNYSKIKYQSNVQTISNCEKLLNLSIMFNEDFYNKLINSSEFNLKLNYIITNEFGLGKIYNSNIKVIKEKINNYNSNNIITLNSLTTRIYNEEILNDELNILKQKFY